MDRTNAINHDYTGTDTAVEILERDPDRGYICFFAVSGDCQIVIGDETFEDNAITIAEGVMWEPKQVPTANIWYKGLSTKLTVLY